MNTNILIFQTAADHVMTRLFHEMKKSDDITCLIQTSKIEHYQKQYAYINFLDIGHEGFYDVTNHILDLVGSKKFAKIFIPSTGARFHQFHNILEITGRLSYDNLCFYNCDGDLNVIKKKHFSSTINKVIIFIFSTIYECKKKWYN